MLIVNNVPQPGDLEDLPVLIIPAHSFTTQWSIAGTTPQLSCVEREKTMKTAIMAGLGALLMLTAISGCCRPALHHPISLDGNYKGRVVEEESREPLEGAVVTAVWYYVCPSVAGPKDHFYHAYETVTDEEGNFFIPGKGIRLFVDLDPVNVYVFKAGYSYLRSGWDSLKEGLIIRDKIQWEGKRAIIPLRKLTDEDSLDSWIPSRPTISPDKMRLLTLEVNKARIAKGLRPLSTKEDKQ